MDGISLLQDFAVMLVVAGISGWIFRKLGLSAVVGYLVAGIIIGPFTPPFSLITDPDRIETFTDLGLAFLMFFVGLGLSLKRIRRLGFGVVATTAVTAFFVFQLSQGFANLMGWTDIVAFIFAAMLMTSSSAIITKLLAEAGLTHERFAQNAQGVTVLEDVVAIVLLTILGSKLHLSESSERPVGDTLFLLIAFAAIIVVVGLLFVPKLLARFGRSGDSDLHSVIVSGLVFIAGVASIRAGFSVALGAFLFGVVIAETPFKSRIEKSLGGAQDMFSAIFFVAIGMLIDVRAFWENGVLILTIAAFAMVARSFAATLGFLATGNRLPLAMSSAVVVTPIGEFAYVIAQLGVDANAVPSSFYAVAVGVSIITAICAPLFAKNAERLGLAVECHQPRWLANGIDRYISALEAMRAGIEKNHVWRLTSRRVGLTALQIVLLGGIFGFSNPLLHGIGLILERAGLGFANWQIAYWVIVLLVAFVLLVSIWQSLQTLCMIYAEAVTMRLDTTGRLRPVVEFLLQIAAFCALAGGVWLGFPIRAATPVVLGILVVVPLILSVVLWRQLISVNIRFEQSLARSGESAPRRSRVLSVAGSHQNATWDLDVREFTLPEGAACAGKTLKELGIRPRFGCTILEIDRQGFVIDRVRPGEALYPGDRVLLFGTPSQISQAEDFLSGEAEFQGEPSDFSEAVLDMVEIPADSIIAGKRLAETGIFEETGIQIIGIERDRTRILNPSGNEILAAGDRVLIMGSTVEMRDFESWILR